MIEYLPYLFIIVISSLIGVQEAVVYHAHPPRRTGAPDEHSWYTATRVLIALGIAAGRTDWVTILILAAASFPFFHDGAYYEARKILSGGDVYPKGWKTDEPQGSTAKHNWNLFDRSAMFLCGLIVIFFVKIVVR